MTAHAFTDPGPDRPASVVRGLAAGPDRPASGVRGLASGPIWHPRPVAAASSSPINIAWPRSLQARGSAAARRNRPPPRNPAIRNSTTSPPPHHRRAFLPDRVGDRSSPPLRFVLMAKRGRRGRGRRHRKDAPAPPPPPPPAPVAPAPRPRRPAPPFADVEPTEYTLSEEMLTGVQSVDRVNRRLVAIYNEIADNRKEIYEEKNFNVIKDPISFGRSVNACRKHIKALRVTAEGLRSTIDPAVAFAEPLSFAQDI